MVGDQSKPAHKKIWVKKKKWVEKLATIEDEPERVVREFEHGPLNDKVADLMSASVKEEHCV